MTPVDSPAGAPETPRIRVSDLGELIRFDSCERRFKLSYDNRAAARRLPFFERLFSPLDPVLQQAGAVAEDVWQRQLLGDGYRELAPAETIQDDDGSVRPDRTPWADFAAVASTLAEGELAYGREISVEGGIEAFAVLGAIDFVLVEWDAGRPRLRLIEGKSSRKDRTYHRIQLVCYQLLIEQELARTPLTIAGHRIEIADVEIAVARIEEDTGEAQALRALESIAETDREEADIRRLLAGDGALSAIVATELDLLPYQLDGKCDGCVFNIDCLSESGRQRRLELLGIEPSTASALRGAGIADVDGLADLDLEGTQARALRRTPGFTESLARLRERARARRSTLPHGDQSPDEYEVHALPGAGQGQLPEHERDGDRLVRIYLAVDYDYTENRVGALSAHITRSAHELHAAWREGADGHPEPDPALREQRRVAETGDDGRTHFRYEDERPLSPEQSTTIVREMPTPWTGRADVDTGAEKLLIQSFFGELVDAIAELTAPDEACRLHFYVWRRNEISRLVEACARSDSRLLGHLRQLLGARESLEQLIFSSVEEEVDGRFGLGWTGRGLIVAASLGWFGRRFHWRRTVRGKAVDLDQVLAQDLFDFKTTLGLDDAGGWVREHKDAELVHRFEIRSRNFDTLPAPYWRAMWGTLPTAHELNAPRIAGALDRYRKVDRTLLRSYLAARVECLRWMEERVAFKNPEIVKQPIPLDELPAYDLGVNDIARAAIDVLRLDRHVAASTWFAEHLLAVRERVAAGTTLPVRDVELLDTNRLGMRIDLDGFDVDEEAMRANWAASAFVRLTLRGQEPERGQTIGQLTRAGLTCVISELDWDSGLVEVDVIRAPQTHYVLQTASPAWAADAFDYATIDSSPSDFVAGRVEGRLLAAGAAPTMRWLDPTSPAIPDAPRVPDEDLALARAVAERLDDDDGNRLDEHQVAAILDGLTTRMQLLQGPPGTGKTATTSVAVLTRILLRHRPGAVLLVGANTHTAVDGLLQRIREHRDRFSAAARAVGAEMPSVTLVRVDPYDAGESPADEEIRATGCVRQVRGLAADSVLVIGGTTSKLLKLADTLGNSFPTFDELIVDEASMMMLPDFLALATLLDEDGFLMLAGDHRQLAPIMAHDWDSEERPPVETYQPHLSAYEAVLRLAGHTAVGTAAVRRSALELSFRLPPRIVELIARVYRQDGIDLRGLPRPAGNQDDAAETPWEALWQGDAGLFLVTHDERRSRKANPVEVEIVRAICAADGRAAAGDIAIVTPHRAQREMLRAATVDAVDVVDTVERLQGGERSAIIVSATASDPSAIAAATDFILDLNRSNVAFSRVKDRLIVVCASTLLDHIPADIEQYDETILWKLLRARCSELVATVEVGGATARIMRPPHA